jgi:hypothetical protein
MIGRAPLVVDCTALPLVYTPVFKADNKALWLKLAAMTRDKPCWTYIRPFQRVQDGRKAFWALYDHYLGPSNVDHMASRAEGKLQSTTYTGETKRWNFERYVAMHVDQHTILHGLERYGYCGIDPQSKVRYLMGGIKTTTLDSIKATVYSNPDLRKDFAATAGLYKDYIEQAKATQPTKEAHVAAVDGSNEKRKYDGGDATSSDGGYKADMSTPERYYSKVEYDTLSPAQKAGLYKKRQARLSGEPKGGKPKTKQGGRSPGRNPTKATQFSKASIKAIAKKVAFNLAQDATPDDDAESSSAEDEPADTSPEKQKLSKNRNNSALKRSKKA